jgi:hypothetical protein
MSKSYKIVRYLPFTGCAITEKIHQQLQMRRWTDAFVEYLILHGNIRYPATDYKRKQPAEQIVWVDTSYIIYNRTSNVLQHVSDRTKTLVWNPTPPFPYVNLPLYSPPRLPSPAGRVRPIHEQPEGPGGEPRGSGSQ